jgi:hypothetical protein
MGVEMAWMMALPNRGARKSADSAAQAAACI